MAVEAQRDHSMEKKIIAGLAALLLSTGIALAQSSGKSNQNSSGTGTSASSSDMKSGTVSGTGNAAVAPKKMVQRTTTRYPKAEERLNRDEVEVTKQLNIQESQEAASKGNVNNSTATNSGSGGTSGNNTGMTSPGSDSSDKGVSSSSQPQ